MIKIKDLKQGYTLNYNEFQKEFFVMKDDLFVFTAKTQDEAETQLTHYLKSIVNTRCPVKAYHRASGVTLTTITSFVSDTDEVWTSGEHGRGKYRLQAYGGNLVFFEVTAKNQILFAEYRDNDAQITKLQEEQGKLLKNFEYPITAEWFSQEEKK